jgi:hypothetical protein
MIARKIKPTICRFNKKNSNKNLDIGKSANFFSSLCYPLKMVKIGWVKIIIDENV